MANPILLGQAEEIDLVQPQVRTMLAADGIYIGGDSDHPELTVPLAVIDGRVFSLEVDEELAPERFNPTLTLHGPYCATGATLAPADALRCAGGCGRAYSEFGLDMVLPDDQWARICPEGGAWCANCIVERASKLDGVTCMLAAFDQRSLKARAQQNGECQVCATPQPQAAAIPNADRVAIRMLVGAGLVTEAKANEALNIAHGFDKGPLTPQVSGGGEVAFRAGTMVIDLSTPQARSSDGVICIKCGLPTMHMGNVCYACSHPEQDAE